MRERAIRLSAVYLAMLALLAGVRYLNRDTYPQLQDLRERESSLLFRLNSLRLDVGKLENPARVKEWAAKNGFVAFSSARHEFAQSGKPLPDPAPSKPALEGLEVTTKWR